MKDIMEIGDRTYELQYDIAVWYEVETNHFETIQPTEQEKGSE